MASKYENWNVGPLCDEIARLEELRKFDDAIKAAQELLHILRTEAAENSGRFWD